jgi:hypothetical protein
MVNARVTSRDNEILAQFPSPPGSVLTALELLQVGCSTRSPTNRDRDYADELLAITGSNRPP